MKPLLLIAFSLFAGALKAQTEPKVEILQPTDSAGRVLSLLALQPMVPGVHLLPQDRMPCLVPETANLVPMPNAWTPGKNPSLKNAPGILSPTPGRPRVYPLQPQPAPKKPSAPKKSKGPVEG